AAALVSALACPPAPPHRPPPVVHRIERPRWVSGTVVTEYWPAPERWFGGRRVRVRGIPGRHSTEWLFGSRGLAMEGTGVAHVGVYRPPPPRPAGGRMLRDRRIFVVPPGTTPTALPHCP